MMHHRLAATNLPCPADMLRRVHAEKEPRWVVSTSTCGSEYFRTTKEDSNLSRTNSRWVLCNVLPRLEFCGEEDRGLMRWRKGKICGGRLVGSSPLFLDGLLELCDPLYCTGKKE